MDSLIDDSILLVDLGPDVLSLHLCIPTAKDACLSELELSCINRNASSPMLRPILRLFLLKQNSKSQAR